MSIKRKKPISKNTYPKPTLLIVITLIAIAIVLTVMGLTIMGMIQLIQQG